MAIAGGAFKANITTLGPFVLPVSERLLFFATLVAKKLFYAKIKPQIPVLKLAFKHSIYAGGRIVIDELEKNLQLLPVHVEALRMTLTGLVTLLRAQFGMNWHTLKPRGK
ncbi:hypothetical protein AMTR_s00014p00234840 [Amborella trichopoda]|uniref:FAE domain-containing protein n=1 Tax=Amborella trichopoda TaxID=13333 RepID=W1PMB6_AMBTC|nr:hypothetical protein AMTR_s00014p00234840 [Amborella trichopoda]